MNIYVIVNSRIRIARMNEDLNSAVAMRAQSQHRNSTWDKLIGQTIYTLDLSLNGVRNVDYNQGVMKTAHV